MTIEQQAKELEKLKLGELRAKFNELLGAETKSNNRPYLIKKIMQALQPRNENAAADPSPSTQSAESSGEREGAATKRGRLDPRLPAAGTVLERDYQGKKLRAKVLEDGAISFRGKTYTSLSKAALAATGTIWNGYVFWNLSKRGRKADQTNV